MLDFLKLASSFLGTCLILLLIAILIFLYNIKKNGLFSEYKAIDSQASNRYYYSTKREGVFYKETKYIPYVLFMFPLPYSEYTEVIGADRSNFKGLFGSYGKDSKHVFYGNSVLTTDKINEKFQVLDHGYVRLGDRTFFKGELVSSSPGYAVLEHGYTRDSGKLFLNRKAVVDLEDVQVLKILSPKFIIIDSKVFFVGSKKGKEEGAFLIEGADSKTFSVLSYPIGARSKGKGRVVAVDNSNVFYKNYKTSLSPQNLSLFSPGTVYNKKNIYILSEYSEKGSKLFKEKKLNFDEGVLYVSKGPSFKNIHKILRISGSEGVLIFDDLGSHYLNMRKPILHEAGFKKNALNEKLVLHEKFYRLGDEKFYFVEDGRLKLLKETPEDLWAYVILDGKVYYNSKPLLVLLKNADAESFQLDTKEQGLSFDKRACYSRTDYLSDLGPGDYQRIVAGEFSCSKYGRDIENSKDNVILDGLKFEMGWFSRIDAVEGEDVLIASFKIINLSEGEKQVSKNFIENIKFYWDYPDSEVEVEKAMGLTAEKGEFVLPKKFSVEWSVKIKPYYGKGLKSFNGNIQVRNLFSKEQMIERGLENFVLRSGNIEFKKK